MWTVYAIYNRNANQLYIGETGNFERRLKEHNQKRGNHFTAKIEGNWVLVYKEQVETRREALVREKQLKSYQGRMFIKKYYIVEHSAPL